MQKILFILLFTLLNACATPPTVIPTQTPSPTLVPTPLPPTPDLDDISRSKITGEYTLVTDDNQIFHLQDKDGNTIPEISIDIDGNIFFGEENTPVSLVFKNKNLTITTKSDETIRFNGEEWVNIPEFPSDLDIPEGAYYLNETHIVDKDGKPLYVLPTEEGEWIKDYPRNLELGDFRQNQLTPEDISEGYIAHFFDAILEPELQAKTDWDVVKDWAMNAMGWLMYRDYDKNLVKFPDPEIAPFIKDTGFCGELVVGKNRYLYILFTLRDVDNQSIEYFNTSLALQIDGIPMTEAEIKDSIRILEEEMNFYPLTMGPWPDGALQADPLVEPQWDRDSDDFNLMMEIFTDIVKKGDMSRISELRHLIFLTQATEIKEDNRWYSTTSNIYK